MQLERGLYGAIVVRGQEEPTLDTDRVLVFDDVQLDRKGQIKPPGWWLESHDGREGSTRLINGRQEPELTVAAGQLERWRLVNAASARYIRLSIGGRPFKLLGTDGGLLTSPVDRTEVLLAPADRVELAVGPFSEGETLAIESLGYQRGRFARSAGMLGIRKSCAAQLHSRDDDRLDLARPAGTRTSVSGERENTPAHRSRFFLFEAY